MSKVSAEMSKRIIRSAAYRDGNLPKEMVNELLAGYEARLYLLARLFALEEEVHALRPAVAQIHLLSLRIDQLATQARRP